MTIEAPSLVTAVVDAAEAASQLPPKAGIIYLLHFDRPYRHAAHYTGWTRNLTYRLDTHEAGHGARLLAVVHAAGITWTLARIWPGTRTRERALKRQGGASRRCPICQHRTHTRARNRSGGAR